MGNSQGVPAKDGSTPKRSPSGLFRELDTKNRGYLTLEELIVGKANAPTHSLPALFFCDRERDGRINEEEFFMLVKCCLKERKKVKRILVKDKDFRELIKRASAAGVKDSSAHGRTSFRRLLSFKDIRSLYSRSSTSEHFARPSSAGLPPVYEGVECDDPALPRSAPTSPCHTHLENIPEVEDLDPNIENLTGCGPVARKSLEKEASDDPAVRLFDELTEVDDGETVGGLKEGSLRGPNTGRKSPSPRACTRKLSIRGETLGDNGLEVQSPRELEGSPAPVRTISMMCSQREYPVEERAEDSGSRAGSVELKCEDLEPGSITALDAAVVESVMRLHISRLADQLHNERARTEFMQWLWKLADFTGSGFVTLENFKIFLSALSEDGIDLEELCFYKDRGIPLEQRILSEFDMTHSGRLGRTEFMVFADLVTREYEFWESRHVERIGNYELGRTVGRGSSGVVRMAIHTETREKCAVKIIKKGTMSDLSRLDTEIRSLTLTNHPNIVSLVEVMESKDSAFLVMELCGGGSLVDIVRVYPDEKMPENTARYYMRQLFEALSYCHNNGICHRDVRVENILLDNNGRLKVTDFGHSGIYTCGWDVFNSNLVGSIHNLSPEQVRGQPYSGEKIDVWSAGVVVYCLLVGKPPFADADPSKLLKSIISGSFTIPDYVSKEAADLMTCMMQVSPDARPSMSDMLQHPWFYSGPEIAPVMDVVNIFVDDFYKRRPDLAEFIMAGTIHDYNLHFHLADTHRSKSSWVDLQGPAWALKCHCPSIDIKFSISLFTRTPQDESETKLNDPTNTGNGQDAKGSVEEDGKSKVSDRENAMLDEKKAQSGEIEDSGSRASLSDEPPSRSEGNLVIPEQDEKMSPRSPTTKANKHGRSYSLDWNTKVTRSTTCDDAFPYQRTLPQRKMPPSSSIFTPPNTNKTERPSPVKESGSIEGKLGRRSSRDPSFRSADDIPSISGGVSSRTDPSQEDRDVTADENITMSLSLRPSKAAVFLTSSSMLPETAAEAGCPRQQKSGPEHSVGALRNTTDLSPRLDHSPRREAKPGETGERGMQRSHSQSWSSFAALNKEDGVAKPQPFLEVRLHDGESGLFLKICRKLKTICDTKLASAAQRQKVRLNHRKSLRGSNSLRSIFSVHSHGTPRKQHGSLPGFQ